MTMESQTSQPEDTIQSDRSALDNDPTVCDRPKSDLSQVEVARLENIMQSGNFKHISLTEMIDEIRGDRLRAKIHQIRQLNADGKFDKAKAVKKSLPAFSVSGKFGLSVINTEFKTFSGVIGIDFDHVPDPFGLKDRLKNLPSVVYVAISPSGDGIKVGFHVASTVRNDAEFKVELDKLIAYLRSKYQDVGGFIDISCRDVRRLMFCSYDPNVYVNFNADPLSFPDLPVEPSVKHRILSATNTTHPAKVEAALQFITDYKYETWTRVLCAIKHEFGDAGFGLFHEWSQKDAKGYISEEDCWNSWESFKRGDDENVVTVGSLFDLAKKGGWDWKVPDEIFQKYAPAIPPMEFLNGKAKFEHECFNLAPKMQDTQIAIEMATKLEGHLLFFNDRPYIKNGDVWQPLASDVNIANALIDLLDTKMTGCSGSKVTSTLKLLKTKLNIAKFEDSLHLLPLQNGVFNCRTKILSPYTIGQNFDFQLGYAYDAAAKCPTFQHWINSATSGNIEATERLKAFLLTLLIGQQAHKILELIGDGGTGKSTFQRLIRKLIGDTKIMDTELPALENNRFETAAILDKRLIMISDADDYSKSVAILKKLSGGDTIRIEKKGVQQDGVGYKFEGLVMMVGELPIRSSDYGIGLQRRRFPVRFTKTVTDEDKAKYANLPEGIETILESELPGILNLILEMPIQKWWSIINGVERGNTLEDKLHRIETCWVTRWAEHWLIADSTAVSPVGVDQMKLIKRVSMYIENDVNTHLYPNYQQFCADEGATSSLSRKKFTKMLKSTCSLVEVKIEQIKRSDCSPYRGIRLRSPKDYEIPGFVSGEQLLSEDELQAYRTRDRKLAEQGGEKLPNVVEIDAVNRIKAFEKFVDGLALWGEPVIDSALVRLASEINRRGILRDQMRSFDSRRECSTNEG